MFIDFTDLKSNHRIEDIASMLSLQLKQTGEQLRGVCPACDSGERALVITPGKSAFYCHDAKKGGDLISLVAHVRRCNIKEAAQFIVGCARRDESSDKGGFQPLDYLEHDHEAVMALGLEQEVAEKLGIGYAKKGIMRGRIAVPIRLADGSLAGYIGITEARLPKQWQFSQSES